MTVRIWDIKTCAELEKLSGHKNGVQSMTFANGDLFTSSFDCYLICWSLPDIEKKIEELQLMRD
jgi:WD40 repeat protein|tara:strand:- start:190 stop:381 length:192 start_codon:yes stop_codon:yes gene_type:complete